MPATGETHLARLLAGMRPHLHDDRFVFATLPPGSAAPPPALMTFEEREGTTLILAEAAAHAAGLEAIFPCRMISLEIHSSLAAIGLLAAITRALAAAAIPVNAVSAFHHDHLFVPADRADEALQILRQLSEGKEDI